MTDATGTRDRTRSYKLMSRAAIPPGQLMGRAYALRPERYRWHILDEAGVPLCERQPAWMIVDLEPFAEVVALRGLVCNMCHGTFSWQQMPHEFVLEDRGYPTLCKVWPRTQDGQGYGRRHRNGRWTRPHRDAYEAVHGEIPDGLLIHHLCEQKDCFEVGHMELVTRAEHARIHLALRGRAPGGEFL